MRVRELRSVVIAVTRKDIFSVTVHTARDSRDAFVSTAAVNIGNDVKQIWSCSNIGF